MQAIALSVETPNLASHDYLEMGRIHVTGWQAAYADMIPTSYLDSLQVETRQAFWRKRLERDPGQGDCEELLVARLKGKVIGWIGYGHSRDGDAETATGEIWGLYVDPALWSQGAGRALVDSALIRLTGHMQYTRVTLWVLKDNQRACSFYSKQGFIQDFAENSVKKVQIGGVGLDEIRYIHHGGKSARKLR